MDQKDNQEFNQELQQNITKEALALLKLGGAGTDVSKYERVIRIIGSVCEIPEDTTEGCLDLIELERDALRRHQSGGDLPERDIVDQGNSAARWTGYDIFCIMQDLFQVSISIDSADDREAVFRLAQELTYAQSFQEWVDQSLDHRVSSHQIGSLQ